MGEWLHSLAAKTTDEKGKPPPSTTQKNKRAENGEMMGGIRGDAGSCVKDYGSLPALQ